MGIYRGVGGTGTSNPADVAEIAAYSLQASNAAAATATLYDNFDDRYLGEKSSDPIFNNDGEPLITGALYFNSSVGRLKVYDGSNWIEIRAGSLLIE